MASFTDPSFKDRTGAAAEAKRKALEQLRAKPPLDPDTVAARQAARAAREAAEDERRVARREAEQRRKEEKAARQAEAKAAAAPPPPEPAPERAARPVLSEAERKAARDARYAARKNRK